MNTLSAVILTKNEEKNIESCLKSLSFCDEIIVIDDDSTDKTVELAKKYNAKIFTRPLEGDFSAQRNFGLSKATGEWILFVDADERVSKVLAEEIQPVVKEPSEAVAYFLKRRDFWWGQELKHGEVKKVRNEGLIRLVKKNSGEWTAPVHETFVANGQINTLSGFIDHYPHQSLAEFLHDINVYSTYRAKELLAAHHKSSLLEIVAYPMGKFFWTYVGKGGFLDGPPGFAYAFLMSFHSFLVRSKLYQYSHIDAKK